MALGFLIAVVSVGVLTLVGIVVYWHIRPNASQISPWLKQQTWDVAGEGRHRAFTDMVCWRDHFYLAYRVATSHLYAKSKLVLVRSPDANTWQPVAEFRLEGQDLRDPKLAVINDRLFLYALKNQSLIVTPQTTLYTSSADGQTWEPWQAIQPEGWVFWRPTSWNNKDWYVVATWHTHQKSALLHSTDGRNWHRVSMVHGGDYHGEVGLVFLSDNKLLCAIGVAGKTRIQVAGGSTDATLIGISEAPFKQWSMHRSDVARLDGPALFEHRGRIYAVARFEPTRHSILLKRGNFVCRKRTSLYLVDEDALTYLSDLPSGGDTSYPGVIVRGDEVYISYYTSDIRRDLPWFLGLVSPAQIRMARIKLSSLPQDRAAARAYREAEG